MHPECSNQLVNRAEQDRENAADASRSSTSGSPLTKKRTRVLAATLLIVVVAAVVGLVLSLRAQVPRRSSAVRIGSILTALPVVDSSGRLVDAAKAGSGKKTIIIFYSPSCDICHSELPKLQPVPAGLGLVMINVSGDFSEEANTGGLEYDAMFYDRDRVFERSFPMPALPTVLFVDEQGVLIAALAGAHQREVVRRKLSEFAGAIPGR